MVGNVIPYHSKWSVKKMLRRLMLTIIS